MQTFTCPGRQRRHSRARLISPLPAALVLGLALPALAAPPSRASLAQASAQTVTLRASAPRFPRTLHTGLVALTLINDTKSEYNASLGRANPGFAQARITTIVAATSMISPRQSSDVTVKLVPGHYLAVCFMPGPTKHGEPHVMEGMIGHFSVS